MQPNDRSEPPGGPAERPPRPQAGVDREASARRTIRAEIVIAALALLTSAGASIAAMLQTREAIVQSRTVAQQLGASVWPYLTFENKYSPSTVTLSLTNQGLGPALIRTFAMSADGRPLHRMRDLAERLDRNRTGRRVSENDLGGGWVIRPSQSYTFLGLTDSRLKTPQAESAMNLVRFDVCYCSLLKDCWTLDSDDTEPKPAGSCGPASQPIEY